MSRSQWSALALLLIFSLLLIKPAQAQTIANSLAEWTSSNPSGSLAADYVATNVTAVPLSRGSGLGNATGSSYNSNAWTMTAVLADAIADGDYLEWGLTATSGFTIDLSSLNIRYDRSSTGPTQITILFSNDNFATSTPFFTDAAVSETSEEQTISLTGLTIPDGGTGLFRLYGYAASGSAGTFDIENTASFSGKGIRITGNVVAGVTLAAFSASSTGSQVEVMWETASELDNLGFNLYRGTALEASPVPLNTELIPSAAPGSDSGASYQWLDSQLTLGETYFYWLEDVALDGTTQLHGPAIVLHAAPTAVTLAALQGQAARGLAPLVALALLVGTAGALVWQRRR